MHWTRFLPLLVFLALGALLAGQLLTNGSARESSSLIGSPVAEIDLPSLLDKKKRLTTARLSQQPTVVNVFASWCAPCIAELPMLQKLADGGTPVYGIAWHDKPEKLRVWIKQHRAPFTDVALDEGGTFGTSIGLTGVPETVIIDRQGRIAYKLAGPLTEQSLNEEILPALEKLRGL